MYFLLWLSSSALPSSFAVVYVIWVLVKQLAQEVILAPVNYDCAFHFPAAVLHIKTGLVRPLHSACRTLLICGCAQTSG